MLFWCFTWVKVTLHDFTLDDIYINKSYLVLLSFVSNVKSLI